LPSFIEIRPLSTELSHVTRNWC